MSMEDIAFLKNICYSINTLRNLKLAHYAGNGLMSMMKLSTKLNQFFAHTLYLIEQPIHDNNEVKTKFYKYFHYY